VAVNVSKLKIYATGRGNKHEKDEVTVALIRRYADAPIQNNDEADATGLAMMGARLLGEPYEKSLPQTHLRAMEGLALP
jgi:Holliday junction resolvasome RuvABC endonuclease subunit